MKRPVTLKKAAAAGGILLATLALVAWSPTAGEDVIIFGNSPGVTLGATSTANSINGAGQPTYLKGVVVGTGNEVGSGGTSSTPGTGYAAVIGNSNLVSGNASVVVGSLNEAADGAPTVSECVRYSAIFGYHNIVPQNGAQLLIGGKENTVNGNSSFVAGSGNTIDGSTVGAVSYYSGVIGDSNQIVSSTGGWAVGSNNTVSAVRGVAVGYQNEALNTRSIALGTGTQAGNVDSSALGRYNTPMNSDDVLVVGTGTSGTVRSTGLRVTSDGGVILGRAQGDISMGDYAN